MGSVPDFSGRGKLSVNGTVVDEDARFTVSIGKNTSNDPLAAGFRPREGEYPRLMEDKTLQKLVAGSIRACIQMRHSHLSNSDIEVEYPGHVSIRLSKDIDRGRVNFSYLCEEIPWLATHNVYVWATGPLRPGFGPGGSLWAYINAPMTPHLDLPYLVSDPKPELPPAEKHDSINSPAHYNFSKIEVIEAIEAWKLGFHLGNVVKYVARYKRKNPAKALEDLEKARWYLNRKIELMKSELHGREPVKPAEMGKSS